MPGLESNVSVTKLWNLGKQYFTCNNHYSIEIACAHVLNLKLNYPSKKPAFQALSYQWDDHFFHKEQFCASVYLGLIIVVQC